MTLYLAIVCDRHVDTMAYPFSTREKAVEKARAAKRYWPLAEDGAVPGWLYYTTDGDGNSAYVVAAELDRSEP
jgi:hypothetical protein